jgi:hypothetical protein
MKKLCFGGDYLIRTARTECHWKFFFCIIHRFIASRALEKQILTIPLIKRYNELTLWSWVPFERPQVVQPFGSSQHFMQTEGSLPSLQELSTCTYPVRPIQSTTLNPISKRSILMLSMHLRLGLPRGLFPSGFPTNNLYTFLFSPIRATCPIKRYNRNYITRAVIAMKTF